MTISGTRERTGKAPTVPDPPGFSAPRLTSKPPQPPSVARPLERGARVHLVEGRIATARRAASRAADPGRRLLAVHRNVGNLPVGLHATAGAEERLEVRLLRVGHARERSSRL